MNKIIAIMLMLMPIAAMADDFADCTTIGYQVNQYTVQECTNKCQATNEYCAKEINKDEARCQTECIAPSVEECSAVVEKDTKLMRENYLVFKCPATDARRAAQAVEKDTGGALLKYYVNNDGAPFDVDVLLNDTDNVYIFRGASGFGVFAKGYKESHHDSILGSNPDDPELVFGSYNN